MAIEDASSITVSFPNNLVTTNLIAATIDGGPAAATAILVNNTNFSGAIWLPFSSSPYVLLGTNDGTYNVWFGFKGTNGLVYWSEQIVTLDATPPSLVITNPVSHIVSQPIIQLQGYSREPLSNISYDVSNIFEFTTNQMALVTDEYYDTNSWQFTTNYFQCFDVHLVQGTNTITVHATDMAGHMTATNFTYMLDYSSKTNPPVVQA
jgi:hypothetical protein